MALAERNLHPSPEKRITDLEERLRKLEEIVNHTYCFDCEVPYGAMLSDTDILRLIKGGRIGIDPLPNLSVEEKSDLGTCKVDFHLGGSASVYDTTKTGLLGANGRVPGEYLREINLEAEKRIILNPGEVIIATTLERLLLANDIAGRMEGKSSIARKGVHVHAAALFDPGWDGFPMMELQNVGRIAVELQYGMPICAMSFEHLSSKTLRSYKEIGTYKIQLKAQA